MYNYMVYRFDVTLSGGEINISEINYGYSHETLFDVEDHDYTSVSGSEDCDEIYISGRSSVSAERAKAAALKGVRDQMNLFRLAEQQILNRGLGCPQ